VVYWAGRKKYRLFTTAGRRRKNYRLFTTAVGAAKINQSVPRGTIGKKKSAQAR